jgi:hypothetical protein
MNKVSRNVEVFVVSTHFHPEHALGEAAFPASARIVHARARAAGHRVRLQADRQVRLKPDATQST